MFILRVIVIVLAVTFFSFDRTPESAAYNYIDQYRDLAIVEMYRTGIPASITLAQGLHESNYGMSDLAIYANNHFGIKCKREWIGNTYYHKDDDYDTKGRLIDSCFRAYMSDIDSYVDHSNFLMTRENYSSLFSLSSKDYVGWAYGLKQCGYATDKRYAEKLIKKIETYGLDQYDFWANPLKR